MQKKFSEFIADDCLVMGKLLLSNIDNNIKASKLTSMGKLEEEISEVDGVPGMNCQYKLQTMLN